MRGPNKSTMSDCRLVRVMTSSVLFLFIDWDCLSFVERIFAGGEFEMSIRNL